MPQRKFANGHRSLSAGLRWVLPSLLWLLLPQGAGAEVCWNYTDFAPAPVPLKCVQQGDMTTSCSWSPNCNTDLDPSDCCVSTSDPSVTQTIGVMHNKWHQCLGNVGTNASPPPPGRGQRWFGFHRQLERDFNEYREPTWDKIEPFEWCPNMNMPYGHHGGGYPSSGPGSHPLGCGVGIDRPDDTACDDCVAFRQCLFLEVGGVPGGPSACSATPGCSAGGVSFPYTSLDQFASIDEVATLLDAYFHADMHQAVADADGGGYVADASNPVCSTRDAMFWRLHKALDDVARAWQDDKAVDVTLVIDRSGSMGAASGTGVGTRLDNAKEAVDMFADLLEEGRSDGATNRLGIISYSSNASNAAMNMVLTDVDATLRDPGGLFDTTLSAIGAGGATSIGSGIEGALAQLCSAGDCEAHIPVAGENQRKAILLLTDGRENTSPCLEQGCAFGGGGTVIDYAKLDTAQLCAVGLGNEASVNGDLLTILAERQGGIYMNNTDASGTDLKDFFVKCYAQLTDEFIGLDPKGVLAASEAATSIIQYDSCDDSRIIFTSGWLVQPPFVSPLVEANRLQLLVNAPDGTPWIPAAGSGEASSEELWAFKRVPLPYQGESQGTWTMQLVRPQRAFVNGFTTDSFLDPNLGVAIVRRQIQRMCPVGQDGTRTCANVLYYEDLTLGTSVYQEALSKEAAFTVASVTTVNQPADLLSQLESGSWDLVVYASQPLADAPQSYDSVLAGMLCQGQKAIVTETRRTESATQILACAGASIDPTAVNITEITGDADFLAVQASLDHTIRPIFSYPLIGNGIPNLIEAHFVNQAAAIIGTVISGGDAINWHANVLVKGLTKLTPFVPKSKLKTGDTLEAAVRILPSYQRAGGYPDGVMSVELERPLQGFGSLVSQTTSGPVGVRDDPVHSLEHQLSAMTIPTSKVVYPLNDRGENGDLYATNGVFSADLPISAGLDGMYTLHYTFEYPVGTCTARRELKQSLFIDVKISPNDSNIVIDQPQSGQNGMIYPVGLKPTDALGNPIGPGRRINPTCTGDCSCDLFTDNNDGSYSIAVEVPVNADIKQCRLDVMGVRIPLVAAPVGVPMFSTGALLILWLSLSAIAWRISSRYPAQSA